jgi:hypothetical protein
MDITVCCLGLKRERGSARAAIRSTRLRPAAVAASALAFLLAAGGAGCGKSEQAKAEERKAVAAAEALRQGRLLVQSNRASAAIEAKLIPTAGVAPAAIPGTAGQPIADLAPGKYAVTARSDGWPDVSGEATVVAGGTAELTLDFKSGALRLDSLPTGATVVWGQAVLGKTPLVVAQLPPGECALTLNYPGWPPFKTIVAIAENTETSATARLPHGRLVIESGPPGATVMLGKRALGQTPLTIERFQAGRKTLVLQAAGFPNLEVPVVVEDQGELKIRPLLAESYPLLDAPATLQAVWFELPPNDPNRLSPDFDPFPGFHKQGSFVRNLNRKKLFEQWLGKTYRFTGMVKVYDPAKGSVEFVEQVSALGKIKVFAQLLPAARDDKEDVALLAAKEAPVTIYGRFAEMEEFDRRSKQFEIEFTQADVVR